jgi:pimeloyl-ACP methyl ester carboxylesterase
MLKAGDFSDNAFTTVVGAGHSYGSFLTQGLTAKYPTDLDAAVLTGFSVNTTALNVFLTGLNLEIASQNQPLRFSNYNNTYLVSSTFISNQIGFFRAPGFDPLILQLAEATKGAVTIGQLFSQNAVSAAAPNFTAPVVVVDGAEDLPFCYGNCSYPTNHAEQVFPMLYPNVATHASFLAPVTGHGVNLHYSAVTAYNFIQKFIMANVK